LNAEMKLKVSLGMLVSLLALGFSLSLG
jgi:hypothetical protein